MAPLTWLHLTDLHVGKQNYALETVAMRLHQHLRETRPTVDAVFVTGDLTWSGIEQEYVAFRDTFVLPLRQLFNGPIFVVPGNHDLASTSALPPPYTGGDDRFAQFFDEDERGRQLRQSRAALFQAYDKSTQNWPNTFAIRAAQEVSRCVLPAESGIAVPIILINTALFSDYKQQEPLKEPAPLSSLQRMLLQVRETHPDGPIIVLGHHPVSWFLSPHQAAMRSAIVSAKALYLHGHAHEPSHYHTSSGVAELGFGAAYVSRGDWIDEPPYRNMYALCTYERDLVVQFMEWSAHGQRWQVAGDLPAGLDPDTKGGSVSLSLLCSKRPRSVPTSSQGQSTPPVPVTSLRALDNPRNWPALLRLLEPPSLGALPTEAAQYVTPQTDGATEYSWRSGDHGVGLRIYPGRGQLLSKDAIVHLNAHMDCEGFRSYYIVTLGSLADDARQTYARLAQSKNLRLLDSTGLIELAQHRLQKARTIASSDLGDTPYTAECIVDDDRLYLVVSSRPPVGWFWLIDQHGIPMPESCGIIDRLRNAELGYAKMTYGPQPLAPIRDASFVASVQFDEAAYLQDNLKALDSIRYAPLAAVGIRLSNATLKQIFVELDGEVDADGTNNSTLDQYIDELVEGMRLDSTLRAQYRTDLRVAYSGADVFDTGKAASLYRKYGSLIVLGNPGSGKSFFAKREALRYAEREESWYSFHLPVFVPLVTVASILEESDRRSTVGDAASEFLHLCVSHDPRGAGRIPTSCADQLFAEGRMAIFFDGLDEIASVKSRERVGAFVTRLYERGKAAGNRFVVTSRPAAIEAVTMPAGLATMTLTGMNTRQIRTLAARVLRAALTTDGDSSELKLTNSEPGPNEAKVIDALLVECERRPGLGRLATNPLLLTLLIVNYANGGIFAVRRHRIYQQAVATLVSVRNRELGEKRLSDADVKRRLGLACLKVFEECDSVLPPLQQFVESVRETLESDRSRPVPYDEALEYVKFIATSTGLLHIHERGESVKQHYVSFMHHSFMEFFVALGLQFAGRKLSEIVGWHRNPRWKEPAALFAGLISEQAALATYVSLVLRDSPGSAKLTADELGFCLECALETDVPSEAVLSSILTRFGEFIAQWGRFDVDLVSTLAGRLAELYRASHDPEVERFVFRGLHLDEANSRAAYLTVLGHIAEDVPATSDIWSTIDTVANERDATVQSALVRALRLAESLLRPTALNLLSKALGGNVALRLETLSTLLRRPQLAAPLLVQVHQCMTDTNASVALQAARVTLAAGESLLRGSSKERSMLLLALKTLAEHANDPRHYKGNASVDIETVVRLVGSELVQDREIGLMLLAWVVGNEQGVHDLIMHGLRGDYGQECVPAGLIAARYSASAQRVLRRSEAAEVVRLTAVPHALTVRRNAIRCLAVIAHDDAGAREALFDLSAREAGTELAAEALRTLAVRPQVDDRLRKSLERDIETMYSHFSNPDTVSAHRRDYYRHLLQAVLNFDWESGTDTSNKLFRLLEKKRKLGDLEPDVLLAWVATTRPNVVNVNRLAEMLGSGASGHIAGSLTRAAQLFIERVRARMDNIESSYIALGALRDSLIQHALKHVRQTSRFGDVDGPMVRESIEAVESVLASYNEYATAAQK